MVRGPKVGRKEAAGGPGRLTVVVGGRRIGRGNPREGSGLVRILLTNDDGVHAPGLRALRKELARLGEVTVIAPWLEQSGVGHSITLLNPLVMKRIEEEDGSIIGTAVEGSPADCVKLAIYELLDRPPDLIVSGINAGANAGINVLYSGTVAAAIEGAFFQITSIAVSLELSETFDYPHAAKQAVRVIEQILANKPKAGSLFNVNLPSHVRGTPKGIKVVPMGIGRHGEGFEKRQDPRGRTYYWMTYRPPFRLEGEESDVTAMADGYITVTPLHFDMTRYGQMEEMKGWDWKA
jgi:5'-nucleotidase